MSDIKYRLGFTINAETLFTLLSKFLPIENLTVEELVEPTRAPADERPLVAKGTPFKAPRVLQHMPKPKHKHKRLVSRHGKGPNLKAGINGIILAHLSDGMGHAAMELRKPLKAAGYSESSVSSRMEQLHKNGVVEQIGHGEWRLTEKHVVEAQPLPKVATTVAGHV